MGEKKYNFTLDDTDRLTLVGKALSSEVRIKILKLLTANRLSIVEIAGALNIPASSAAMNVRVLEEAGLIGTEVLSGVRGSAKQCCKAADSIQIEFTTDDVDSKCELVSMPIGNYVDYKVEPTCGIVSDKGEIDEEDEPRAFYNPDRTLAKLLWIGSGYVEYRFPNHMIQDQQVRKIEFSAEICAEDHEYNMEYPSDITMWINDIPAGCYHCPSDFGGRRGKLNPDWWPDKNTQYGMLKTWKITEKGTYLDNEKVSDNNLGDYKLSDGGYISVRIGNADDAQYKGGLNLFGDCFGDYPQDIIMKITYK